MLQNTNTKEKTWVYTFVRTDLPIEQVLVQSNHASLEAGIKFGYNTDEPSSLIVIACKNKAVLEKAFNNLTSQGISLEKFYEPDWDYGFTAFASEPVTMSRRSAFRKYQLFSGVRHVN